MLLGLLAPAILLSFSRAAWGQIVYTALLVLALTFLTTRSPSQRLRIVLLSVTGVVVLAAVHRGAAVDRHRRRPVQAARQPRAELRPRRAGPLRAATSLGAVLALDMPLGIGPLQFSKYLPRGPAQLLSQRLHVRRLALRRVLSGAGRC